MKYMVSNNRSGASKHTDFYPVDAALRGGWDIANAAARVHDAPSEFSRLPVCEWRAAPEGGNTHRDFIFRDRVLPELPFSSSDSSEEEEPWRWLAE